MSDESLKQEAQRLANEALKAGVDNELYRRLLELDKNPTAMHRLTPQQRNTVLLAVHEIGQVLEKEAQELSKAAWFVYGIQLGHDYYETFGPLLSKEAIT